MRLAVIIFVALLLIEGGGCFYLLKEGGKAYKKLYDKYIRLKKRYDVDSKLLSDAVKNISWKDEKLDKAKNEIFILNQKIGGANKEIKKYQYKCY